MLGIALFVFGWVHVSKHVHGLSALGRTIEQQNAEIAGLTATIERIQTLKSMQVDLRLKLFGEQAIPISMATTRSPAAILSGDVLAAARKANVEFAAMDPAPAGVTIRFWGRYPDVVRFLSVVESTFPRLENFAVEKSKNGGVLLTLTVPVKPS